MRNTIPFLLAVFFAIIAFSNFKHTSINANIVFSQFVDNPNLPSEPFDYEDIEFPSHILGTSDEPDTIGYSSGGVDTLAFENITNHGATLGRVLFYDEKLSALENISCGSCHIQELSFADGEAFSEGVTIPTKRNSMNLNDIAWSNNNAFFWDMSQTDIHTMIRLPLTDDNEIGADMDDIALKLSLTDYYPQLFTNAFGSSEINEELIVDALVQFIESMVTFNSKFDQAAENNFQSFSEEEILGRDLFANNCTICHSQGAHSIFGEIFIDPNTEGIPFVEFFPFIFNNGLPVDPDDAGAGEWNPAFDNLFKIPSLRNIELTGPYMHDGRFSSLSDVIKFYSEETEENEWTAGFIPPGGFQFTDQEQEALVAFLKTLTDESFTTDEKWSDPFKSSNSTQNQELSSLIMRPNPMHNFSIIEWDNPANKETQINIFDSSGRLISTSQTNDSFYEVQKADLLEGMYIIELIMGDKKSSRRLIIQ